MSSLNQPSLNQSRSKPRVWEAYALRYATVARRRIENFIMHDLHDGPSQMDYFVWYLQSEGETILVDTGFNQKAADQRKRQFLRCPMKTLQQAGVPLDSIKETIITHAHYDHAGNIELLPKTQFHLQEKEMNYATGKEMRYRVCRHAYDPHDVCNLVFANYEERVAFHEGEYELRSGVSVHLVGGHTRGLQIVRVFTSRGWIVLASDAAHYLENYLNRSPFPIVTDVADMIRGYEKIDLLADSKEHVISGHDPLTMEMYQRVGPPELEIVSLSNKIK
jgi:glyoxylase-like metal-dependent hydrolase (beta-lactamase superfamily II)